MAPTLETLDHCHRAQSYGWPFETLDVFLTGKNALDKAGLAAKLGGKARGGWCFELNEWLALALEGAGFTVRRLLARNVWAPDRPRTHQITLVEVEGALWTADAGFGAQTPREPLKLEEGYERVQDGLPYRVRQSPPGALAEPEAWFVQSRYQGAWKDLYRFTLETASAADFAVGNHYHLTHPASTFADARVVTVPVPGGRRTLVDRTLKTWRTTLDGEVLDQERALTTRGEYADTLAGAFGLTLGGAAIDRLWNLEPSVSRGSRPLPF
jgi:N-hydroxyarylamine O-acetyltransferase